MSAVLPRQLARKRGEQVIDGPPDDHIVVDVYHPRCEKEAIPQTCQRRKEN